MPALVDIPPNRVSRSGFRYVIQRVMIFTAFAAVLFASAGTLRWVRGWAYVLLMVLIEAVTLILLALRAPETLNQRGTAHAGVKGFDRVFLRTWMAMALITPAVAGLDARHGWSSLPMGAAYAGALLIAAACVPGIWAMLENEHFEQFVRIQDDRRHRIVTTGPYRIVRHPGYAATVLGAPSVPLMLGSLWTFVPVGALMVLFVIRTVLEDRTLRQELDGYAAFAQRTRYRLVPGVW